MTAYPLPLVMAVIAAVMVMAFMAVNGHGHSGLIRHGRCGRGHGRGHGHGHGGHGHGHGHGHGGYCGQPQRQPPRKHAKIREKK